MTRRLVMLRHGETDHNRTGRAQGHLDVPLNDRGLAQARAVAPVIAAFRPQWIVSSDLARARVTAETVAAHCDLAVRTDPRLREFAVGDNRQDRTWEEYAAAFPHEVDLLNAAEAEGADGPVAGLVPGWESVTMVLARWRPALVEALAAVPEQGTGLLVAHGGVLRLAVADFLGLGPAGAEQLDSLANCGWAVLAETPSVFRGRSEPPRWRLQAWNRQVDGGSVPSPHDAG